jgi:hypothetical protein
MIPDYPHANQGQQDDKDVSISPAEPLIRADAMALLAAVGSIINLGTTGRTLHSDAN